MNTSAYYNGSVIPDAWFFGDEAPESLLKTGIAPMDDKHLRWNPIEPVKRLTVSRYDIRFNLILAKFPYISGRGGR